MCARNAGITQYLPCEGKEGQRISRPVKGAVFLPRMKIRMGVPRTKPLIESIWGKIRILGVGKEVRRDADMEEIWRNVAISFARH